MIYINKGQEPEELKIFNRNRGKRFIQWGDKSVPQSVYGDIRKSLYYEQKGNCAYCLRRIDENCQIEHFIPRSKDSSKVWDYNNMLGVDNAKKIASKYFGLCENGRGNAELTISPLNITHMQGIRYLRNGKIIHDSYQTDLDNVLQLNHPNFMSARKAIFDAIDKTYQPLLKQNACNIYDYLMENYENSEMTNFNEVAIWYLNYLHNKNII